MDVMHGSNITTHLIYMSWASCENSVVVGMN